MNQPTPNQPAQPAQLTPLQVLGAIVARNRSMYIQAMMLAYGDLDAWNNRPLIKITPAMPRQRTGFSPSDLTPGAPLRC